MCLQLFKRLSGQEVKISSGQKGIRTFKILLLAIFSYSYTYFQQYVHTLPNSELAIHYRINLDALISALKLYMPGYKGTPS